MEADQGKLELLQVQWGSLLGSHRFEVATLLNEKAATTASGHVQQATGTVLLGNFSTSSLNGFQGQESGTVDDDLRLRQWKDEWIDGKEMWTWFDTLDVEKRVELLSANRALNLVKAVCMSQKERSTGDGSGMFLALENRRTKQVVARFKSWDELCMLSSKFEECDEKYKDAERSLLREAVVYDSMDGTRDVLSLSMDVCALGGQRVCEMLKAAISPSQGHGRLLEKRAKFAEANRDDYVLYSGGLGSLVALVLAQSLRSRFQSKSRREEQSMCSLRCVNLFNLYKLWDCEERKKNVVAPACLRGKPWKEASMLIFSAPLHVWDQESDREMAEFGKRLLSYQAERNALELLHEGLEPTLHHTAMPGETDPNRKRRKRKKRKGKKTVGSIVQQAQERRNQQSVVVRTKEKPDELIEKQEMSDVQPGTTQLPSSPSTSSCSSSLATSLTREEAISVVEADLELLREIVQELVEQAAQLAELESNGGWEHASRRRSRRHSRRQRRTSTISTTISDDLSCCSSDTIMTLSDFEDQPAPTAVSLHKKEKGRKLSAVLERTASSSQDGDDEGDAGGDIDDDGEEESEAKDESNAEAKTDENTAQQCSGESSGDAPIQSTGTSVIEQQVEAEENEEDEEAYKDAISGKDGTKAELVMMRLNQKNLLHADLQEMASMLEMVAERRKPWQLAVADLIKAAVAQVFPGGTAEVFGSLASGLAAPGSDVDMVVRQYTHFNTRHAMQLLAQHLREQDWVQGLQAVQHTAIPVIRLSTACIPISFGNQGSLISVDITFETNSHHGLRTCSLVRELIRQYPPLRPLTLVLKQFLLEKGLNDPFIGGLSSYGLVLMIVDVIRHNQTHMSNLGYLFIEFLSKYKDPSFDSPPNITMRNLPLGVPLYIQDPLDPNNNIGRSCFGIRQVIQAFAEAYDAIQLSSVPLRSSADWSLLGAVFSTGHHKHVVSLVKQVWCPPENQVIPEPRLNEWALSAKTVLLELLQNHPVCPWCKFGNHSHHSECKLHRLVNTCPE